MSALRHRTVSLLLLVLFCTAGLVQYAPAICCQVEEVIIHDESDSCCPGEEPRECPEKQPCEDKDTCPKSCCATSSNDLVLQAPLRNIVRQAATAADISSIRPVFLNWHRTFVPHTGNTDPPPTTRKTALHLYLQVFLR